jgi:hypothetical protein
MLELVRRPPTRACLTGSLAPTSFRVSAAAAAFTVVLAFACTGEPVEWSDPMVIAADAPIAARLMLDQTGAPTLLVPRSPLTVPPSGRCSTLVAFTRVVGNEWIASWWRAHGDGRVELVAARSADDGSTWSTPVVADGRDRGGSGCQRPAPYLAADSVSGYVHLVYFAEPPDGAGVYFTHSMAMGAPIGVVWHTPVGVVFGETPVRASVAAVADTVVVAYESPNSRTRRIGLALSRTAGHTFEQRVTVSGSGGEASVPMVALRGRHVAVAWREGRASKVRAGMLR